MKKLFKTLSIIVALSACAPAFANTKLFAQRAYRAASIALGASSVWQDMQIKKERNQFVPTVRNINTEKAAICGATGLAFSGLGYGLLKKGLTNKVPMFALAGFATDTAIRTYEHQIKGNAGLPAMPHYVAMKDSVVSFWNSMCEKARSLVS
jgi:hypothetical protein